MLTTTPEFKNAMLAPIKRVSGYIVLEDGTRIDGPDSAGAISPLHKYTIQSVGGLLKTAMSKLTLVLSGERSLTDTVISVYYGVKYDDEWHYVLKGKFTIVEATYKKDNNTTELIGYDNMLQFQREYTTVGEFPTTLYSYLVSICSLAGVMLSNENIYNGSLTIPEDYYQNISEYTVRDILEDICEASASYAIINPEGNLVLRQLTDSGETLDYDSLKPPLEIGDKWGDVNSLVLSRQPQNDDAYVRNDQDINRPTTRNILDLNKFRVGYSMEES